jgi:hypothetical protein
MYRDLISNFRSQQIYQKINSRTKKKTAHGLNLPEQVSIVTGWLTNLWTMGIDQTLKIAGGML